MRIPLAGNAAVEVRTASHVAVDEFLGRRVRLASVHKSARSHVVLGEIITRRRAREMNDNGDRGEGQKGNDRDTQDGATRQSESALLVRAVHAEIRSCARSRTREARYITTATRLSARIPVARDAYSATPPATAPT